MLAGRGAQRWNDRVTARWRALLESVAVSASLLCLIHCVALPIAIAALPALSNSLDFPSWTHAALLALAMPLSLSALIVGYDQHGAVLPAVIGAAGLGLMAMGLFMAESRTAETGLTVIGTVLVAVAHLRNWRLWHARERVGPGSAAAASRMSNGNGISSSQRGEF